LQGAWTVFGRKCSRTLHIFTVPLHPEKKEIDQDGNATTTDRTSKDSPKDGLGVSRIPD
jgi:hypothetical protein